jgi:hypothetical protein
MKKTFLRSGAKLYKSRRAAPVSRLLRLFQIIFALIVAICIANKSAQADSIPVWNVTGTITLTGNNVCNGLCTETIMFGFDYTYTRDQYGTYWGRVTGNPFVSSYGDLGSSFAFVGGPYQPGGGCGGLSSNYIPFINSGGDDIDLKVCDIIASTPVTPTFYSSLYSCRTAACRNGFAPTWFNCTPESLCAGIFLGAKLESNVVQVPEGGTELGYLAVSCAGIGCAVLWGKRKSALADTF